MENTRAHSRISSVADSIHVSLLRVQLIRAPPDKAVAAYTDALRRRPDSERLFKERQKHVGKLKESRRPTAYAYNMEALKISGLPTANRISLLQETAELASRLNQNASRLFDELAALDPKNAEDYRRKHESHALKTLRGEAEAAAGSRNPRRAVASYQEVIKKVPADRSTHAEYLRQANLLGDSGDAVGALKAKAWLLAIARTDMDGRTALLVDLAEGNFAIGRHDAVVFHCDAAVRTLFCGDPPSAFDADSVAGGLREAHARANAPAGAPSAFMDHALDRVDMETRLKKRAAVLARALLLKSESLRKEGKGAEAAEFERQAYAAHAAAEVLHAANKA